MPKVFIANQVALPYDSAKQFGDLVPVTRGYVKFDNIRELSNEILRSLYGSSSDDFLVLSGNNLVCSMVTHLWLEKHHEVNILHWEPKENGGGGYVIIPMRNANLSILSE